MRIRAVFWAAALLLAIVPLALGAPVPALQLTNGAVTVTITDQGAGDMNSVVGAVTFVGAVGVFTVNVTTGLDPDILGPAQLDLNSVDVAGAGGTLDILFSTPDLVSPPPQPAFMMNIGGTIGAGSSLLYAAYLDPANVLFGTTSLIGTLGPFGSGPFSGTGTFAAPATPGAAYSLTQAVTITATGAATTSFDAELLPTPEPSTMLLTGIALLLGGALARRRLS